LSQIVSRVTFPVFSTLQDDRARLKRGVKKALTALVLVNFPMMIGLAIVARPLVLVLLTEKWAPSIPYVQLLCAAGLLFPLQQTNLTVLQALGRSDLFLRLEIIKKTFIVVNIAITWRWGISAMIYGMVALSFISYYLNSYYTGLLIDYPVTEQVLDLAPYLLVSLLMGAVVFCMLFSSTASGPCWWCRSCGNYGLCRTVLCISSEGLYNWQTLRDKLNLRNSKYQALKNLVSLYFPEQERCGKIENAFGEGNFPGKG
jgi:O-antigen/teichoic acid export membrane protein